MFAPFFSRTPFRGVFTSWTSDILAKICGVSTTLTQKLKCVCLDLFLVLRPGCFPFGDSDLTRVFNEKYKAGGRFSFLKRCEAVLFPYPNVSPSIPQSELWDFSCESGSSLWWDRTVYDLKSFPNVSIFLIFLISHNSLRHTTHVFDIAIPWSLTSESSLNFKLKFKRKHM